MYEFLDILPKTQVDSRHECSISPTNMRPCPETSFIQLSSATLRHIQLYPPVSSLPRRSPSLSHRLNPVMRPDRPQNIFSRNRAKRLKNRIQHTWEPPKPHFIHISWTCQIFTPAQMLSFDGQNTIMLRIVLLHSHRTFRSMRACSTRDDISPPCTTLSCALLSVRPTHQPPVHQSTKNFSSNSSKLTLELYSANF